jgi:acyl-CoA reductase-like NAD-dependent aldehyde dehydrogenase
MLGIVSLLAQLLLEVLRQWKLVLIGLLTYGAYYMFFSAPPLSKEKRPARSPEKVPLRSEAGAQRTPIPCVTPLTGERFAEERSYTKEMVDEVIERAHVAQREWAQTSFAERRAVLADLLVYILAHQEEICQASIRDSGKTALEAAMGEILVSCEKLRWMMLHGEEYLAPESRPVPLLLFQKKARVEYFPMGVIGIIIPGNYPFHNILSAVASTLFAGNSGVVKVSEWSTGSSAMYERIFRQVLAARGHNPDLVQLIIGFGETGGALAKGDVDLLFFIGSPNTGKRVMQAASERLTPVILELGGKDPFIVFDDANLDHVADIAIRAAFINCGQNCIAAERFYVQAGIYDRFVATITQKAKSLRQEGAVLDAGAITMPSQVTIIEGLVNDAVAKGAKAVVGGKKHPTLPGLHFQPTVLLDVTQDMKVVNEEAFGPLMPIVKFTTEEEVIAMANRSVYALAANVFSSDYKRAERVAKQLVCGMLVINDWATVPLIQSLPFGGCKASGFGRFNGPEGLRGFSRQKAVVTDRFPGMLTQTPALLRYPLPLATVPMLPHIFNALYGTGAGPRLAALGRFMQHLIGYVRSPK